MSKAALALLLAATAVDADDRIAAVIAQCAPHVHPQTMGAVIRTESAGNPLAINVNGGRLQRQPASREEAVATAAWLQARGYNFDAGLAQINSANYIWLGLTPESVFDPCANLGAAETVLLRDYESAVAANGKSDPVLTALSKYNTGHNTKGFSNGYVRKVQLAAAFEQGQTPTTVPPIPLVAAPSRPAKKTAAKAVAAEAPSPADVFGSGNSTDVFGIAATGDPEARAQALADAMQSGEQP